MSIFGVGIGTILVVVLLVYLIF